VVIDGEIAYTGSMNLVDPRYFKQDAGVGEWIDAMVRLRGPIVESLGLVWLESWEMETGEATDELVATAGVRPLEPQGPTAIQAVPSGPLAHNDAISAILLMAIYSARRELILTSPYFVPDEALLTALVSAALRGVDVTLVVPQRVDSHLVSWASQAFQGDLMLAGVKVALFRDGLLHTKSITVDGAFSLFGSLNLDPRSLHLNFELTLAVYHPEFTAELRQLQLAYVARSVQLDLAAWQRRSAPTRLLQNTARLFGPLL
jgi:cardiolipin synthase